MFSSIVGISSMEGPYVIISIYVIEKKEYCHFAKSTTTRGKKQVRLLHVDKRLSHA